MKRVVLLFCLLALAGTSFAGFSIGFKQVEMPTYVDDGSMFTMDMNLLRIGAMASPEFRIEGYIGYAKETYEWEEGTETVQLDGSAYAFGAGGYYVIELPANTSFSIGLQFLYASSSSEYENVEGPSTTSYCIDPLMRVDFAIPGAERLAFFAEYGGRYASATTTVEVTGADDIEYKWNGLQTYAPDNILAGLYYVF